MNQSLIIARKEYRAAFRNRLFLTITLLFLGLSILSVYIGSATKRAEMRIYNETIATLQADGVTVIPHDSSTSSSSTRLTLECAIVVQLLRNQLHPVGDDNPYW